jgi:hypothetical protein
MLRNQVQAPRFGKLRDIPHGISDCRLSIADWQHRTPGPARRLDIPARETIMSAMRTGVLVCLLLATGASAKATRTFVLTGRVVDAITGRPIPGARVFDDSGATSLTDDSGKYRLALTEGTRYERAEAAGMFPAWAQNRGDPRKPVADFHMFSRSCPAIEGQVIHAPSRTPQQGASVSATGLDYFVLTDTIGRYILPLPSFGTYVIRAGLHEPFRSDMSSSGISVLVPTNSHPVVDLTLNRRVVVFSDPWPRARLRPAGRWGHPDWSEFRLDSDCIERYGGLNQAIGQIPGVLIR